MISRIPIPAAAAVLLLASAAYARAPTLEELPTVERVFAEAREAKEEAARLAEAAKRDPKMDLIRDYQEGHTSLSRWKPVTEIIRQEKERKYRDAAAWAIRVRFKGLPRQDPTVLRRKKEIGIALLSLLRSRERDVRVAVSGIFRDFWPGEYAKVGYDPNEVAYTKLSRRVREWERFLRQ